MVRCVSKRFPQRASRWSALKLQFHVFEPSMYMFEDEPHSFSTLTFWASQSFEFGMSRKYTEHYLCQQVSTMSQSIHPYPQKYMRRLYMVRD